MRRRRISPVVLGVVLLASALARGEEPGRRDQPLNYGRTPDTAIPYRNFHEPHARFFQEVMEFRGTGRAEASCSRQETVRIGYLGPSGSAPDADLGRRMLEGVQLAVARANEAGGYQGVPFELIERADLGLWGATSNEIVAFKYTDDVLAVIGSIDGANTHIALRVALKLEMPMINTGTTDPTLTETNIPWLLRCMADDRQQGYALAHHIFQECGLKNVVAFRVNDRYGRMGIAEFRDAARRLKRPLRMELRWKRGDHDFTAQLDRIAQASPEAIVLWGNAADTARVVKRIRQRKMPVRIFGCDRLASQAFLTDAGTAAEGVVAVASYDPTRDDVRLTAFTEAYQRRFDHTPETFAAHAYDGANILIAAIQKAGLNRARIRDALYELEQYGGVTGTITFDTTLNDIGSVYLASVTDGKFVYRTMDFTTGSQAQRPTTPYRGLAQSPPVVRSPEHADPQLGGTLRIGCFLTLDEAGQAAARGARLALADAAVQYPGQPPIELIIRDARGSWGDNSAALVDLVSQDAVLAVISSTERRATHLAETLAAKLHFPIVSLCGTDPTITRIPLPWVFCVAPGTVVNADFAKRYFEHYGLKADGHAAAGYDAAALVVAGIRSGGRTRVTLRERLAAGNPFRGVSGTFHFDALGNRINDPQELN